MASLGVPLNHFRCSLLVHVEEVREPLQVRSAPRQRVGDRDVIHVRARFDSTRFRVLTVRQRLTLVILRQHPRGLVAQSAAVEQQPNLVRPRGRHGATCGFVAATRLPGGRLPVSGALVLVFASAAHDDNAR